MSLAAVLLDRLRAAGIEAIAAPGGLRLRCPTPLAPELHAAVAQHRTELRAILAGAEKVAAPCGFPGYVATLFPVTTSREEGAGGAGDLTELPRLERKAVAPAVSAWGFTEQQRQQKLAKLRARTPAGEPLDSWHAGVARLQEMAPLPGFRDDHWRRIQIDAAALLDERRSELQRLGWTTVDVFGVHPIKPGDAVDCYGLAVLLNGGKLTELTPTSARFQRESGAILSFVRVPATAAVPIWAVVPRHD